MDLYLEVGIHEPSRSPWQEQASTIVHMTEKTPLLISIKWKLSLALVTLSIGLVGTYVYLAKDIFESDKISYVYDSQLSQINDLANEVDQSLEQVKLISMLILSTYDATTKSLNSIGEGYFLTQQRIAAIDLLDPATSETVIKIEKDEGFIARLKQKTVQAASTRGMMTVARLDEHTIVMSVSHRGNQQENLQLNVYFALPEKMDKNQSTAFFLIRDEQIISTNLTTLSAAEKELLHDIAKEKAQATVMRKTAAGDFLVSSQSLKSGGLIAIAITPKAKALGALNILFKKSMVFVFFSSMITILCSLILAKGLTSKLTTLTQAVIKVSKGDFSPTLNIVSNDEVAVLANSFKKMGSEIQRLLLETKDKARMEEELKTARLVQESLFPKQNKFHLNRIQLMGFYTTSTECGGDWWFYFQKEQDVYIVIADATGHGTPAALITSAARSLFSIIEKMNLTLAQIMDYWDDAVFSCSDQKVNMTAALVKINSVTGEVSYMNACHEPPLILTPEPDGSFSADFVQLRLGNVLGTRKGIERMENHFVLKPNQNLVLLTDGLFSLENAKGNVLTDTQYVRKIKKAFSHCPTSDKLIEFTSELVQQYKTAAGYPDDVTMVSVFMNDAG